MRISTAYQYDRYSSQIASSQARYMEAQMRVSTGKRINKPSDDPSGVSTILNVKTLQAATKQYAKNVQTAKGVLGFTESALSEAATMTRRAYELTLSAANSTTTQPARDAMIQEIEQMQRNLVDLANTQGPKGEYVFGGQKNDARPFTVTGSTLVYNGDSGDILVETGAVETMTVNSKGDPLFTNAYAELESLKADLSGGNIPALSGVHVGAIQDVLNQIQQERGVVGAKLQTVDDLTSRYTRMQDDFTKHIADVEEVDVDQAIVQYRLAETAYSAALQVASQGFRLSLMDFING
ncbi:MAG: flagellar hook-associated protein FlgL [Fimbriimonadaceae bacterium]|nr:flagellar hook-associated protein FlgL [Fimbriimonadaceae bacterium]